ncbi:MAG TPA: hypothetical protein VFF13_00320 [archaeon]|nr:hypothetical protein [archaeon]
MGSKRKAIGKGPGVNPNQGEFFHGLNRRGLEALKSKHHVGPNFHVPDSIAEAQKMHSALLDRLTAEERAVPKHAQSTFENRQEMNTLHREINFIKALFPSLK